jgi:hypothetical protein
MYHSVGIPDEKWRNAYLTCPFQIFEEQLKYLKKKGYVSITLDQYYDYIFKGLPIPDRSLIFTFDDGYADNYIFAYPLLKKYGFKGVIYMSSDFIRKDNTVRKRLDEVNDNKELNAGGFLSMAEMKIMERSGVMEIQAHASSHTFYPVSDTLIDFRHPGDDYYWMTWNHYPEMKDRLFYDDESLVNWGEPVFEFKSSLLAHKVETNKELSQKLIEHVNENGGKEFFLDKSWKAELKNKYHELIKTFAPVISVESDADYRERIEKELSEAKAILEAGLDKKIRHMCWPHGSASKTGMDIAEKLGYLTFNTGKDTAGIKAQLHNSSEKATNRIARFSPVAYWNGVKGKNAKSDYLHAFAFYARLEMFRSWGLRRFIFRTINYVIKRVNRLKMKKGR